MFPLFKANWVSQYYLLILLQR